MGLYKRTATDGMNTPWSVLRQRAPGQQVSAALSVPRRTARFRLCSHPDDCLDLESEDLPADPC